MDESLKKLKKSIETNRFKPYLMGEGSRWTAFARNDSSLALKGRQISAQGEEAKLRNPASFKQEH